VAWVLYRSILHGDPESLIQGWMHASPVHTPFVPFVSAIFMAVFGESRIAAEAVLPVFSAVWLVATYFGIRRLYDSRTAAWATTLVSCFPLFLTYSRTYLFEHPLAAMFACACYALLVSDGFSRTLPTAAFGVLAGLTCLTRGGAPIYFVGPLAVILWQIRALPDKRARLHRFLWALSGAALIAMTWYGANSITFLRYVQDALYGQGSAVRVGDRGAFWLWWQPVSGSEAP
jgi:4-amino-4-deoxy-L-arabinose transferase-like glycosyltransferase